MKQRSFAVIGLGQFGMTIVEELVRLNENVIAIDIDENAVRRAAEIIPTAFVCDSTDEKALKELEIPHVTHAIVCYGDNIQASILTTVILKDFGIDHIVVRMDSEYYIPIIQKLGATEVVTPQRLAGLGLANRLGNDDFLDFYSLGGNYSVVKITVRKDYIPVTIEGLNPRNEFGVNLILISRAGRTFAPKAMDKINPGDIVFVVGTRTDIQDFGDFINKEPDQPDPVKKKAKR